MTKYIKVFWLSKNTIEVKVRSGALKSCRGDKKNYPNNFYRELIGKTSCTENPPLMFSNGPSSSPRKKMFRIPQDELNIVAVKTKSKPPLQAGPILLADKLFFEKPWWCLGNNITSIDPKNSPFIQ